MMSRTDRSIRIAGEERAVWVDPMGQEFVEQDGDFILIRGAKIFKSETSRGYPLPHEAYELLAEARKSEVPFHLLSDEEQRQRLERLFLGILDITQKNDKP